MEIVGIILDILIVGLCITIFKEVVIGYQRESSTRLMLNLIWLWPLVIIYFIVSKIIKSFFWILDEISSILNEGK